MVIPASLRGAIAARQPCPQEVMDCHGLRPRNDGPIAERLAKPSQRHREERSDAAIHAATNPWIATAYGLAMIESALCKKF